MLGFTACWVTSAGSTPSIYRCMYVCMYVYIYICIYIYTHTPGRMTYAHKNATYCFDHAPVVSTSFAVEVRKLSCRERDLYGIQNSFRACRPSILIEILTEKVRRLRRLLRSVMVHSHEP